MLFEHESQRPDSHKWRAYVVYRTIANFLATLKSAWMTRHTYIPACNRAVEIWTVWVPAVINSSRYADATRLPEGSKRSIVTGPALASVNRRRTKSLVGFGP